MSQKLAFTVDLPNLMQEAALFLTDSETSWAGVGLINGFMVSISHLYEIAKRAEELDDPILMLRLFAIGVISNPIEVCRESVLWDGGIEELARILGAI